MNKTTKICAPAAWAVAIGLVFTGTVFAQEAHDHGAHEAAPPGQHDQHMEHDQDPHHGYGGAHDSEGHGAPPTQGDDRGHHDHGAAAVTDGPWSYLGRDNPAPHTEDRWVMVPVPGEAHAFRFVREVEAREVCAGLDGARVMVDRATREACEARPDALPFQGVAQAGPQGHGGAGADHDGHSDGHPHHPGHHGHDPHGHGHGPAGAPADHADHGDGTRAPDPRRGAAPEPPSDAEHEGHGH